jgi:hypothetical protein
MKHKATDADESDEQSEGDASERDEEEEADDEPPPPPAMSRSGRILKKTVFSRHVNDIVISASFVRTPIRCSNKMGTSYRPLRLYSG